MRKILVLTLLVFSIAGCISSPNGNYASAPIGFDQKMAEDTVKQLVLLYPPAHTRFTLKQSPTDAYGAYLVKYLRLKGYAIAELSHTDKQAASKTAFSSNTDMTLEYIVDSVANTNLYRVTINVGKQTLSRAYVSQNGSIYPSVSWARKE